MSSYAARRLGPPAALLAAALVLGLILGGCGSDPGQAGPSGISPASAGAVTMSPSSSPPEVSSPSAPSPDPSIDPTSRPSRTARPSPTVPPSTTAKQAAAEVAAVSLRPTDPGVSGAIQLYPGGDRVQGEPTFALCGYDFSTESHRLARRKVAVLGAGGVRWTSEVVAYADEASAALSLHQFAAATKTCDPSTVLPPVAPGDPFAAYDVTGVVGDIASLPVMPNIVGVVVATPTTGAATYSLLTYQQRGDVVVATSFTGSTKPTKPQLKVLVSLAGATGRRLAALPAR